MNQIIDAETLRNLVDAIGSREINVAGVKVRPRVLSAHLMPAIDEKEKPSQVVLRLDLRPSHAPVTGAVMRDSLEARLCKIGFTVPFRLDGDLNPEIDRLVVAIGEEAPKILAQGNSPQRMVVESVPPISKVVAATGALVGWGVLFVLLGSWNLANFLAGIAAAVAALIAYESLSRGMQGPQWHSVNETVQWTDIRPDERLSQGSRWAVKDWILGIAIAILFVLSFMKGAETISRPVWVSTALVIAAVATIPVVVLVMSIISPGSVAWRKRQEMLFKNFKPENEVRP